MIKPVQADEDSLSKKTQEIANMLADEESDQAVVALCYIASLMMSEMDLELSSKVFAYVSHILSSAVEKVALNSVKSRHAHKGDNG